MCDAIDPSLAYGLRLKSDQGDSAATGTRQGHPYGPPSAGPIGLAVTEPGPGAFLLSGRQAGPADRVDQRGGSRS